MERITHFFDNETDWHNARRANICSTDISVLLGCGQRTAFELFHEKKGTSFDFHVTEHMERGKHFQAPIAEWMAKKFGLVIRPMNEFMSIPELRMAASFDYEIIGTAEDSPYREQFEKHGNGILEIKNVSYWNFKETWSFSEAPFHIEAQLQHQLLVSGRWWGLIAANVGGSEDVTYLRHYKEVIAAALIQKTKTFWADFDAGKEPEIDYLKDMGILQQLHIDSGGECIAGAPEIDELVRIFEAQRQAITQAQIMKNETQIKILSHIGDARAVLGDFYKISCGPIKETPAKVLTITPEMVGQTITVSSARKARRNFLLTLKGDE